jgi:hypothetical protein
MIKEPLKIATGKYRVWFWHKLAPTGHDGWVVSEPNPQGGLDRIISKHKTKREAVEKAEQLAASGR